MSLAGSVETAIVEGAPYIRLVGECDMYLAPELQGQLEDLISQGVSRLVFDLERVTFLDSTILRVFLTARRSTYPTGEVVLLCRAGFIRRLLTLLELDQLLHVYTPEEWREHVASVH
jgi:anti-sigma B factor antagonist